MKCKIPVLSFLLTILLFSCRNPINEFCIENSEIDTTATTPELKNEISTTERDYYQKITGH